jgi:hypothetical protein
MAMVRRFWIITTTKRRQHQESKYHPRIQPRFRATVLRLGVVVVVGMVVGVVIDVIVVCGRGRRVGQCV